MEKNKFVADAPNGPTAEQAAKITELSVQGYKANIGKSVAAAGFVMEKGDDFYLFSFDGQILHNPEALLTIKL